MQTNVDIFNEYEYPMRIDPFSFFLSSVYEPPYVWILKLLVLGDTHTHTYMHTHTETHIHAQTRIHIYIVSLTDISFLLPCIAAVLYGTQTHAHAHVHINIYTYIYIYICTCVTSVYYY